MTAASSGNLVITRTEEQTLHIGDDIVITIARAQNNRVKLLIAAPKDIKILRGELVGRDLQPESAEA